MSIQPSYRILLAAVITALLSLGTAHAMPQAAEQHEPSKPDKQNGKVCQSEEVTGSRMKKRVCLTPEQWEARERAGKELKREMDSKPIPKDGQGG
ncbi:MAG: hypothetical protein KUL77_03650 [Thermomonas sp.]|uniref:hypothetical protein n=1 Tax=Thermomonas sp. TaxID=1971895 RepID=UPI001EBD347D|nr:hypothetical protein [Thermomonas sp.]MBV2208644.1 hypothetical protein [Thermomonas sp.]